MEWEGVRHPFRLDRAWSSRLLQPMYHFMYVMNDMLNRWKQRSNHINLSMNEVSSSVFLKNQICFGDKKKELKIDFDLSK